MVRVLVPYLANNLPTHATILDLPQWTSTYDHMGQVRAGMIGQRQVLIRRVWVDNRQQLRTRGIPRHGIL